MREYYFIQYKNGNAECNAIEKVGVCIIFDKWWKMPKSYIPHTWTHFTCNVYYCVKLLKWRVNSLLYNEPMHDWHPQKILKWRRFLLLSLFLLRLTKVNRTPLNHSVSTITFSIQNPCKKRHYSHKNSTYLHQLDEFNKFNKHPLKTVQKCSKPFEVLRDFFVPSVVRAEIKQLMFSVHS